MSTYRTPNRLQIILILLCGVFILALTLELSWSYELDDGIPDDVETVHSKEDMEKSVQPETPPAISDYSEIVERPLFMADRRPARPETGEKPEAEPKRPPGNTEPGPESQYTLTAVIIDGENRAVLIKSASGNKTSLYNEGDRLDNWVIGEIRKNGVTLERGGQSRQLELKVVPSGNTVAPADNRAGQTGRSEASTDTDPDNQEDGEKLKSVDMRRREEMPENRRVFDLYNDPSMKGSDLLQDGGEEQE